MNEYMFPKTINDLTAKINIILGVTHDEANSIGNLQYMSHSIKETWVYKSGTGFNTIKQIP